MIIRAERVEDFEAVHQVVQLAFEQEQMSDHQEHFLVQRLRQSADFIPALSLVCEVDQQVVGYILFSKIKLIGERGELESLALAPVAVLPDYQHCGIGGRLIEAGHEQAKQLGFTSVIVLGHAAYYPKFGYQKASCFGIRLPFDVPEENCMAIALQQDGLRHSAGTVQYPAPFSI
ncbi:N-acetyltransferase [Myroides odoratus]|uniref:GNAT family N-acetyltransferase n=1 Tax=Myroides odoratus TaxID=256 RepID=UPI003342B97B